MFFIALFLLFTINCSAAQQPHRVAFILHGTWGGECAWYMPGGDFFDELQLVFDARATHLVPLMWGGRLSHASRAVAAQQLVCLMQSYPEGTEFFVISHSHGTNVGILASQLLAQNPDNSSKIAAFIGLGSPIDVIHYQPNMEVISYFYNIFSLGDMVQAVASQVQNSQAHNAHENKKDDDAFGWFQREYPAHERIANIRLVVESIDPNHTQLHSATVARWLMQIHDDMTGETHSTTALPFNAPRTIHLSESIKKPLYLEDTDRETLLLNDYLYQQKLWHVVPNAFGSCLDFSFKKSCAQIFPTLRKACSLTAWFKKIKTCVQKKAPRIKKTRSSKRKKIN